MSYLFLQLVLFFDDKGSHGMKDKDDEDSLDNLKKAQRYVALATMCVCFVFFSAYLYQMITRSPEKKSNDAAHLVAEAKFMKRLKLCIAKGDVSIMSALFEDLNSSSSTGDNLKTPLRGGDSNMTKRLIKICKPVFNRYDLDRSGTLSKNELTSFSRILVSAVRKCWQVETRSRSWIVTRTVRSHSRSCVNGSHPLQSSSLHQPTWIVLPM